MNNMTASPRTTLLTPGNAGPGTGLHGHRIDDSLLRAAAAEALGPLVLVLAITATAVAATLARPIAGAPYGSLAVAAAGGLALAALAAAILISGPVSGAGVNPARAIGPMILTGKFTDWWAYLAAPVVAGALAVLTHDQLLRVDKEIR